MRWCILWRVQAGRRPGQDVFVAVDVHYLPCGGASAAAVVAADATFCHLLADRTGQVADVPPYQPGQFYLRELPPLHAVLDGLDGMTLLIVDGYADLDPGGRPGLGAHAHAEFGVPVIGVAKTAFPIATHAVPVVRGEVSARPLYVNRRRDLPPRGRGSGAPHGRPLPATRCHPPRRRPCPRPPAPIMTGSPRTRSSRQMHRPSLHYVLAGHPPSRWVTWASISPVLCLSSFLLLGDPLLYTLHALRGWQAWEQLLHLPHV